ncbi:MAG: alkaline phosphatase family protein [Bacteroidota bacterium]
MNACSPSSHASKSIPVTSASLPNFDHIVIVTFENKDFHNVIGNLLMPVYNGYAANYTLLTRYHAVTHPSLPNYLAMVGGDTFNIDSNCKDCFIDAPSLPDLIEASGRTWKTYQENMQTPCELQSQAGSEYQQKHNPFVYFNSIRLNKERCGSKVVPLEQLQKDIDAGALPSFIFITPNMCNNAHDCRLYQTDLWLRRFLNQILPALKKDGSKYLIVLTWDEGQDNSSCCGLPGKGGGRIPVVLISPLVKKHFQDATPYTHYSLLKTISEAWGLPYLGHAADPNQSLILAPWQ